MFFVVSRIAGFLTYPSNDLFLLCCAEIVFVVAGYAKAGRRCLIASVLLFGLLGLSPFGSALIYPLEQRFPKWDETRGAPDGIVVLGGAISAETGAARGTVEVNEAAERLFAAAALARTYPATRIALSGGNNALLGGPGEAEMAAQLLERLGIARERMIIENRSRNTFENALFTKAIVTPKPGERWLLVTSAYHMPRAVGVFRSIGFAVEAYPVDWRTGDAGDLVMPFLKASDGLARTDAAAHEWLGLVVYRLLGKIDTLVPGPR